MLNSPTASILLTWIRSLRTEKCANITNITDLLDGYTFLELLSHFVDEKTLKTAVSEEFKGNALASALHVLRDINPMVPSYIKAMTINDVFDDQNNLFLIADYLYNLHTRQKSVHGQSLDAQITGSLDENNKRRQRQNRLMKKNSDQIEVNSNYEESDGKYVTESGTLVGSTPGNVEIISQSPDEKTTVVSNNSQYISKKDLSILSVVKHESANESNSVYESENLQNCYFNNGGAQARGGVAQAESPVFHRRFNHPTSSHSPDTASVSSSTLHLRDRKQYLNTLNNNYVNQCHHENDLVLFNGETLGPLNHQGIRRDLSTNRLVLANDAEPIWHVETNRSYQPSLREVISSRINESRSTSCLSARDGMDTNRSGKQKKAQEFGFESQIYHDKRRFSGVTLTNYITPQMSTDRLSLSRQGGYPGNVSQRRNISASRKRIDEHFEYNHNAKRGSRSDLSNSILISDSATTRPASFILENDINLERTVLVNWLRDSRILKQDHKSSEKNLHKICRSGVLLVDIINAHEPHFVPGKHLIRQPQNFDESMKNFDIVRAFIKSRKDFKCSIDLNSIQEIMFVNETFFWSLLRDFMIYFTQDELRRSRSGSRSRSFSRSMSRENLRKSGAQTARIIQEHHRDSLYNKMQNQRLDSNKIIHQMSSRSNSGVNRFLNTNHSQGQGQNNLATNDSLPSTRKSMKTLDDETLIRECVEWLAQNEFEELLGLLNIRDPAKNSDPLKNGVILIEIIEKSEGFKFPEAKKAPRNVHDCKQNFQLAFNHFMNDGIRINDVNLYAIIDDLIIGKNTLIWNLVHVLIRHTKQKRAGAGTQNLGLRIHEFNTKENNYNNINDYAGDLRSSRDLMSSRRTSRQVLGEQNNNILNGIVHKSSSSKTSIIEKEILEWLRDLQIIKDSRISSIDKLKDAIKSGKILYQILQNFSQRKGNHHLRGFCQNPQTTDECLVNLRLVTEAIREKFGGINEIFLDELEIFMLNKPIVVGLLKSLYDHLQDTTTTRGKRQDTRRSLSNIRTRTPARIDSNR